MNDELILVVCRLIGSNLARYHFLACMVGKLFDASKSQIL